MAITREIAQRKLRNRRAKEPKHDRDAGNTSERAEAEGELRAAVSDHGGVRDGGWGGDHGAQDLGPDPDPWPRYPYKGNDFAPRDIKPGDTIWWDAQLRHYTRVPPSASPPRNSPVDLSDAHMRTLLGDEKLDHFATRQKLAAEKAETRRVRHLYDQLWAQYRDLARKLDQVRELVALPAVSPA